MDKEININLTTVAQNRQLISQMGANLGTQYFAVESKDIWQGGSEGFEKDKREITQGVKNGFILNRSPRKINLKSKDIVCVCVDRDADLANPDSEGDMVIKINPRPDGTADVVLPIESASLRAGTVTADVIAKALKGDEKNFFLNPKLVVAIVNEHNNKEVTRLKEIRSRIDSMIQNMQSAIATNNQKAQGYEDQWVKSAIPGINMHEVIGGQKSAVIIEQND